MQLMCYRHKQRDNVTLPKLALGLIKIPKTSEWKGRARTVARIRGLTVCTHCGARCTHVHLLWRYCMNYVYMCVNVYTRSSFAHMQFIHTYAVHSHVCSQSNSDDVKDVY